ncbi:MAG: signal recognition particle-docking protein FtsY, partial [Chitinispirillaceae bacterium]|nr:signal recognition particle-docking protein FtsY [Chitinispirillaceae bacterium]
MSLLSRLKEGLSKTRERISSIISTEKSISEEFFETIEDALISADVGASLSAEIVNDLREIMKMEKNPSVSEALESLKRMLVSRLEVKSLPDEFPPKPWVILVVGVNGVGKTTTIGKMAYEMRNLGKKVLLGAADTFRAGAIEQLKIWAERTGSDFVSQQVGADPASVAFDALEAAKARNIDVVMLDTAGRLHNKVNLMNEMEKILRVIKRHTPHAPNEILMVVDATIGQNAINQVKVFNEVLGLTGLIVTKLDGTAKGGIAIA